MSENKYNKDKSIATWNDLVTDEFNENEICVNDYYNDATYRTFAGNRIDLTSHRSAFSNRNGNNTIIEKISQCRKAYENIGLIGNVVDIMTDFALEGFQITHEIESAERLFNRWAEKVDLYSAVEEILRGIFRDGNVPIVTYNAKIKDEDISNLKNVVNKAAGSVLMDSTVNVGEIPYKFSILDVMSMQEVGADLFGNNQYRYMFDQTIIKNTLNSDNKETKELLETLREGLSTKDWENFKKSGAYPLDSYNLEILYYKKDSFDSWANPMLWRIVDDLKFKKTLRNMDISVAESITNTISIFKLGNASEGMIPSATRLQKFASLLKNPSKSKQIVWDDLVTVESDDKEVGKVLGEAKYKQVNNDILAGLGISEVLIGGDGGNYSNSFLSCRTLLERLETGRNKVLRWVRKQLAAAAVGVGIKRMPIVKFANMSLRDETAEKKMLLELLDRNIISYKTLLERFGEDFNVEVKRMRREDTLRKKFAEKYPHTLRKVGKFGPQIQQSPIEYPNSGEDDNKNGGFPTAQGPQGDKGGRPGDDGGKQDVVRDTNPKGMSWRELLPYAIKAYEKIEKISKNEDVAFKMFKSLSVEKIINFDINTAIDMLYTEAPAKLDRCVDEVYAKLVKKYKDKTGNAPGKKKKKELKSSAWAICKERMDE